MYIIHLLKALTKMHTGDDEFAGSPPPVCRLNAYGNFMLSNVPVVISSFKHELPDGVDYYTIAKQFPDTTSYNGNSVPVISSITVVCNPVYSRDEMKKFNVTNWLDGTFNKPKLGKGYL
jgi:hypothetical protein